jgi:hypothetical protein
MCEKRFFSHGGHFDRVKAILRRAGSTGLRMGDSASFSAAFAMGMIEFCHPVLDSGAVSLASPVGSSDSNQVDQSAARRQRSPDDETQTRDKASGGPRREPRDGVHFQG